MRSAAGAVLALLCLVLVGARSPADPKSGRSIGCPPEATIVARVPPLEIRGRRTGNVDGDRTPDRVSVVADYAAPPRCRFFLVAVTRRSSAVLILEQGVLPATPRVARAIPWPRLYSLRKIDRRPGAEIAVVIGQGASAASFGLFSYDGHLRRVGVDGIPLSEAFVWADGAIAAAVDCVAGRDHRQRVFSSSASRVRRGWHVDRRVFAVANATLRLDHVVSVRVTDLKSLPEFRSGPSFGSCSGA